MSGTDTERRTRQVFHRIHARQADNAAVTARLRTLITTELLGVADGFFEGKVCADLGCGSAVVGTLNLLDLGAEVVHALDLDDSFVETATAVLEAEPGSEGRWRLDVGSVSALPYADGMFDYVLCQGVLHHVDDDAGALREIVRVLKPGGIASFEVHGRGGLMTRIVMAAMRDQYADDEGFRELVDEGMTPAWIADQLDWLAERIDDDGSKAYADSIALLDALRGLLDEDFILTLRDRVQAPTYAMYPEADFQAMLRDAGFASSRRVSRRPTFSNIRKVLAPLYAEYDAPLSRLVYGNGILIFVAVK